MGGVQVTGGTPSEGVLKGELIILESESGLGFLSSRLTRSSYLCICCNQLVPRPPIPEL